MILTTHRGLIYSGYSSKIRAISPFRVGLRACSMPSAKAQHKADFFMKGFGIYVKNNLLENKHIEHMGISVWLYMWLLDKMTSISEEGVGKVLGGRPIKFEEIKQELGIARSTYARWVDQLASSGYISILRTPYGLVFSVFKAEKIFGRSATNGTSEANRDVSKVAHQSTENEISLPENGTSNKTIQLDNTHDNTFIAKVKKYSSVDSITEQDMVELADRYQVPLPFVRVQYEKMCNWLGAKGKRYKNYKMGLANWVLKDAERVRKEASEHVSKRGIDARGVV